MVPVTKCCPQETSATCMTRDNRPWDRSLLERSPGAAWERLGTLRAVMHCEQSTRRVR
jgi:hypothetical protein